MNLYESIKNNLKETEIETNKLEKVLNLLSWDGPKWRGAPAAPEKPFGINEKNFADNMRAKEYSFDINSTSTNSGDSIEIKLITQEDFDTADMDTFIREVKRVITNILNELKIPEVLIFIEAHTRGEDNRFVEEFIVKSTDGSVVLNKAEEDNANLEESNLFKVDVTNGDKKETILNNATKEQVETFVDDLHNGKAPSVVNDIKEKGFSLNNIEVNKTEE